MRGDDAEGCEKPDVRTPTEGRHQNCREIDGERNEDERPRPKKEKRDEIQIKEGWNEVAEAQGIRGEALAEVAAVKTVATELTQVRKEKRAAMMVDDNPRVVDDALPIVDDVFAEERIFAWPEVGAIAADAVEEVLANEEIAAGVVLDIFAHAAGFVAIAIVAGDEDVVVDAAANAGEGFVAWRRDAGAADGADVGFGKIAHGVFKPVGIWVGVVIDERDNFAAGFLDAAVAFFGGAHLARRDDAEGVRAGGGKRDGRIGVRQNDALPIRVSLRTDRGDAFVEHPARARARNDDGNERLVVSAARHKGFRVIAQDAQAVKDGEGIARHLEDGARFERAKLFAKTNDDGGFRNACAEGRGNGEEFEVERVSLDQHTIEGRTQDVAAEKFHACLGIRNRQAHEDVDERKVDGAHEATMPRILHNRAWMTLGTDDDVHAIFGHRFEKERRLLRMDVEVAIEEHHVRAGRRGKTRAKGRTLATILRANDRANRDVFVRNFREFVENCVRSILRAIVNWNELGIDFVLLKEVRHEAQIFCRGGRQLVERHNNRKVVRTHHLTRQTPFLFKLRHRCYLAAFGCVSGVRTGSEYG